MNIKFFLLAAFLSFTVFPQSDGNKLIPGDAASYSANLQKLKYNFSSINLSRQRYNAEQESLSIQVETPSKKSPWLAFGLSIFYPGLGQLYNAEYGKALLMGGLGTVGLGLFMLAAMSTDFDSESNPDYIAVLGYTGAIIGGGAYIWSLIDAPVSASNINEKNRLSGIQIFSTEGEKLAIRFRNDVKLNMHSLSISLSF